MPDNMNNYLLLRDNKQTGPHSLAEMLELGFKKYDLVWVEGKSAAWRYPGELDEFKAISPLVEEQPFDRLFKKPDMVKKEEPVSRKEHPVPAEKTTAAVSSPKMSEEVTSVSASNAPGHDKYLPHVADRKQPDPRQKSSKAQHKYVAVTLPASSKPKSSETKAPAPTPEKIRDVRLPDVTQGVVPEKPVYPEPVNTPATVKKVNHLLQYSGRAAALVALLMVGIMIGMAVNNKPRPEPYVVPSEPSRITELKEKINVRDQTEVPSIPVVDQQYLPQQQAVSEGDPGAQPSGKASAITSITVRKPAPKDNSRSPAADHVPAPVTADSNGKRMAAKRSETPVNTPPPPVDISNLIDLSLNEYKVGLFGGIQNIEVTLRNRSEMKVKEVIVELRFVLSNRKFLTETVRFENIDPGASLSVSAPDSERGIRLETRIIKLVN
jgi:hypothetical protein